MSRLLLAVFDENRDYVSRFLDYIKENAGSKIKAVGFSENEAFLDFMKKNKGCLYLIPAGFDTDALKEGKNYILFGEERPAGYEGDFVNKYQTMEKILEEVTDMGREAFAEKKTGEEVSRIRLICIYAPVNVGLKDEFVKKEIRKRKENSRLLYVNMEHFPKDSPDKGCGLSDIIYVYKTNPLKLGEIVEKSVYKWQNVDSIRPVCSWSDLREVEDKGWPELLREIGAVRGADAVIADMGDAFGRPEEIFERADEVYVCCPEERMDEFKGYFEENCGEEMLRKINVIK